MSEWIPCSERLPELLFRVVAWIPSDGESGMGRAVMAMRVPDHADEEWMTADGSMRVVERRDVHWFAHGDEQLGHPSYKLTGSALPTHWMPAPGPPAPNAPPAEPTGWYKAAMVIARELERRLHVAIEQGDSEAEEQIRDELGLLKKAAGLTE
jgi:hypothetical protein